MSKQGVKDGRPEIEIVGASEAGVEFRWVAFPEEWRGCSLGESRHIADNGWGLVSGRNVYVDSLGVHVFAPGVNRTMDCIVCKWPKSEPLDRLTNLIVKAAEKYDAEQAEKAKPKWWQPSCRWPTKRHEIDAEEMEALEKSSEHWRDNKERKARGEAMHVGAAHCACCRRHGFDCDSCIIGQDTGAHCAGTPYREKDTDPSAMLAYLEDLMSRCTVKQLTAGDLEPGDVFRRLDPVWPGEYTIVKARSDVRNVFDGVGVWFITEKYGLRHCWSDAPVTLIKKGGK